MVSGFFARRWKDLLAVGQTTSGKIGLILTTGLVLLAIIGPYIVPYQAGQIVGAPYSPPSPRFLLGTDDLGEDILSQLIVACRGSVLVALAAGFVSTSIGVTLGLFAGYYGGKPSEGVMRATDAVLVLPLLPLLIVVAAYVPQSIFTVIVVIGLLSWPATARTIYSQTLTLKARPFVDISRISGMSDIEIMFKVLLPNEISLAIAYGVFAAVNAVVVEAGLDFIGLGSIQNFSWGIMLYFALSRNAMLRGMWQWFLPPGIMIALLGTGLILVGYSVEKAARIRT
jgi:ABC-type dipeptide/oligopeptide/nickel transport system permease subunit